jgi:flagellar basal-body rod protein FlgF
MDKPALVQGVVELSNVNIIREMVDMIDIQRTFEVYQKVIQTMSEEDKIAVTRIGRLA